jgi:biopolymer transport protein ExbD
MALPAPGYRGYSFEVRRESSSTPNAAICDINITPLIDVMLVLLVTLILTLPITTHAVRLVLPQAQSAVRAPVEAIDLDINFDGSIVWNGTALANFQQLEAYLQAESQKNPQPQIRLRPDPHVKYDLVAKVLASAQRHGVSTIAFVDTAAFID